MEERGISVNQKQLGGYEAGLKCAIIPMAQKPTVNPEKLYQIGSIRAYFCAFGQSEKDRRDL